MAKTISELRNQSIQVRDASAAGENTATRVGTVLNDIVGHIEDYENTQSSNNSSQDAKIEGVKSSLNAEIARAKTEESNLSTQIGTERTERQAAVSREETARIQADNDEKTARENADITLRTMIQTEVSNRQIAVKQEEIRAKAAEEANAAAIENVANELSDHKNLSNSRYEHVTDEINRLDTVGEANAQAIADETARAKAAEEANTTAIADETARAKAAEEANTTAIADETARAKAAEEANAASIIDTDRIADNSVTNAKIAEREQSVCSIIYSKSKLINFNTLTGKMEIPADTGFRTNKRVIYLAEDVEVNYKPTTGATTTAIFLNIRTNEFRVGNSGSDVDKENEILVCLGRIGFDKNGFDFILGGDYTVNGRLSKCDFYNGEITINEFTEANMSKYKESGVANNRRWFLMPVTIYGKLIKVICDENYYVAVLYLDSNKNILSDTGWKNDYQFTFPYRISYKDVSYIRISLRRVDNEDMTDEETYSTAVSSFCYVLLDSDFLITKYTSDIISRINESTNKSLLGVCYTTGFIPNIDSSARTLDLGGDFIIKTRFNDYIIKDRTIPLCDTTLGSSAQVLVFDTATQTFKHGAFTYVLGDTEILIGFTRFQNNTDYQFYKFNAAFEFTVDGIGLTKGEKPVSTNETQFIGFNELKPFLKFDGYNRIVNYGYISTIDIYPIKIKMSENSPYQVALREFDELGNMISDSHWRSEINKKKLYANTAKYCIWFRREDNSELNDETINDIGNYIENISLPQTKENYKGVALSFSEYKDFFNEINDKLNYKSTLRQKAIKNIAHQGYSIVEEEYIGNSRVSSYIGAAKAGFNFGECDLKFTSDNVAVCCHDTTFRDTVTGELITISEHTLTELKTYTYYHEKIASFEEVVNTCKIYGIGLYIDHIGFVNSSDKWQHLFNILKKYKMEERVWWLTTPRTEIIDFYNRSKFSWVLSEINDSTIESINNVHTQYPDCEITIDVNYSNLPIEDLIRYNSMLSTGVSIEVWTIDDESIYKQYIPYVSGITSNKISELMIWED